MSHALRFVSLLSLLTGCDGIMAANVIPGTACRSDDDCDSQAALRACLGGVCADPGCPAGTVYVGAGSFSRGCDAADPDCLASAQPLSTVQINHALCVSATELSVAQYRACVSAGRCPGSSALRCSLDLATWTESPAGNESLPMTCLLWSEAESACRFQGGRLPTEAEWEKAARGRDGRMYPWGRLQPLGCTSGANYAGPGCLNQPWSAVSSGRQGTQLYSASRAVDMAGNVWEWVTDYYADSAYKDCAMGCTDPLGPLSGVTRGRRGGGFQSTQFKELKAWWRDFHTPETARSDSQGARCVFPR